MKVQIFIVVMLATSVFSLSAVKKCKQSFRNTDVDHDGFVNLSELMTTLALVKGSEVKKYFNRLDKNSNGDGKLSISEICKFAR